MSFTDFSLIAHRGCSSLAPENTLASFKAAKAYGATGVELDVALLQDNTAVIFHDKTVDRCTNGSGFLHEYSFEQLQSLDAGSWFSPDFKDEPIPTLNETLRLLTELQLDLNLELKPCNGNEKRLVNQISSIMARHPHFKQDNLLFSSFHYQALKYLRQIMPKARVAILYEKSPVDNWKKQVSEINANAINLNVQHAKIDIISQIRKAGLDCYIWGVNDRDQGYFLKSIGASGIITDYPQSFHFETQTS